MIQTTAPENRPDGLVQATGEPVGSDRLKLSVIWSYTLSRVAFSIMGVMFGVYLMKYATDVLFIAPATMGVLIATTLFRSRIHWWDISPIGPVPPSGAAESGCTPPPCPWHVASS